MPNRLFTTLVIAVGLIGSAEAQRSRYPIVDESTITRTLAFGAGSRTVNVRNINGFLHVTAGDGPNVEMSIHKTIRAQNDADKAQAERDVRLDFAERAPYVEGIVQDRRGEVCGEDNRNDDRNWSRVYYDVRFDFTIRVPRDVKLRLCTINGGDLTVDGTRGDFEVDNVNGPLEMTNVAGSGHAHTVNGAVKVSFTANPTAASSFKTVNGNVDVSFQDGLSADLRMKTMNGGLFTDFDAQPLPNVAPASGERRNGRFVFRANEFTRVRVGRGGPEISFETLNGSVRAIRAGR